MSIRDRLYVGTIASDAVEIANDYQIGIEVDEFCTAENMDVKKFSSFNKIVKEKINGVDKRILHAPFNELFPSAIDPMALEHAYKRFNQAYEISKKFNINRMVVHTGYVPHVYFKNWFSDRSIEFWQDFMRDKPENFHIMLENVLEDEPYTLSKLIESIGDKRVTACLDIGHAYYVTDLDLMDWIKALGPWLGHVHLHNNNKIHDYHWSLGKGDIPVNKVLEGINRYAPNNVTYTVENIECRASMEWLSENGWI